MRARGLARPHIPAPCPASSQCCTVLRKVTVQFCPLYIYIYLGRARLYNHSSESIIRIYFVIERAYILKEDVSENIFLTLLEQDLT